MTSRQFLRPVLSVKLGQKHSSRARERLLAPGFAGLISFHSRPDGATATPKLTVVQDCPARRSSSPVAVETSVEGSGKARTARIPHHQQETCANQPAASKATPASCMVRLASLTAPAQTARACRNRIRTPEKHMPGPLRTGVHTYLASCNRLRHHGGDGNRGVGHADPSTTERRAALRASLPAPPRILVAAPCSASLAHTCLSSLPDRYLRL